MTSGLKVGLPTALWLVLAVKRMEAVRDRSAGLARGKCVSREVFICVTHFD